VLKQKILNKQYHKQLLQPVTIRLDPFLQVYIGIRLKVNLPLLQLTDTGYQKEFL